MDARPVRPREADAPYPPSQQHAARRANVKGSMVASTDPWADDAPVDVDTCRICRGEATEDEPLFFPCKCSGSIKYVHQDCLMEWLSHSQKKHCELCKTAFRFTKLYSPDMPKHLPFHIFVHHMTKYLFRNVLVWLRATLVASVWLGWLPYLMRSIWAFMFWLSDEGFGGTTTLLDSRIPPIPDTNTMSITMTGTTMCPSTPLLAVATTPASLGGVVDQLPVSTMMKAVSRPLNVSTSHSWLRVLFGLPAQPLASAQEYPGGFNGSLFHKMTKTGLIDPRPSLLSDVKFLNRITRNPAVNRVIIHVLEGQVITLLAIVCFILIILVRDYVVQQQPEINVRAALAAMGDLEDPLDMEERLAEFAPAAQPAQPAQPAPAPAPPAPPAPPTLHVDIPEYDSDSGESSQEESGNSVQGNEGLFVAGALDDHRGLWPTEPISDRVRPNLRPRPIVGMGRRPILNIPDQIQTSHGSSPVSADRSPRGFLDDTQPGFLREPSPLGIDRDGTSGPTTVSEYVRIYRAADGDNDRIREIIRQEGLDEARFSRFLRTRSASPSSVAVEKACSDSSSWTWAGSDDDNDTTNDTMPTNKGKSRADESNDGEDPTSSSPSTLPPSISRHRAVSDGPQRRETINPLANNSWSFSNLPSDTDAAAQDSGVQDFRPESTASGIKRRFIAHVPDEATETSGASNVSAALSLDSRPSDHSPSSSEPNLAGGAVESNEEPSSDIAHQAAVEDQGDAGMVLPSPDAEARRAIVPQQHPNTIVGRVADFMWGDVPPPDADGARQEAVDIFGDNLNPPFMHDGHGGEDGEEDDQEDDEEAPEAVEVAVAAGLDPGAVEDAEDFDGIMELIGMRGPIAGLFQNAVFCAFLVSISIFLGVFVPYNIGRVSAWVLANPTRLLRILFSSAKLIQDVALLAVGYTSSVVFTILEAFRLLLGTNSSKQILQTLRLDAGQLTASALDRIASSFMFEIPILSTSEMRNFSAVSHQALLELKSNMHLCILIFGDAVTYLFGGDYFIKWLGAAEFLTTTGSTFLAFLTHLPYAILHPSMWMINLNSPAPPSPLDLSLTYWNAQDRSWAVLLGYASLTLLAALYLSRGATFSTGQAAQEWEASIIDALNQASGVMKVILIISIEMLVFPFYCGLLLDVALLPLFEDTTLKSRVLFAYNYPLTSIFVHWFIGTGYMFHFALFVSMCRKIMRKGVLYFIRDPDDPEFHPVRDVLERNVATQLRKILFSAFVYGALVVICLGGVVWGLAVVVPTVLPIHYTYNEPVLEFPVDLLFCNFLMPLAVKFFKPSDGLHTMYTWWFRQCARALRLTYFLFGERRVEEEGKLVAGDKDGSYPFSSWRAMFLGVNAENDVALKSWRDYFSDGESKPASKISKEDMLKLNEQKRLLVESGKLIPDGRFVNSPATDQTKVFKGQSVFRDIAEEKIIEHLDEEDEREETALDLLFQPVYIPPWFRARISIFIISIWIFAAVTGVGSTILPLVFGRHIFKALVPPHIRTNDIYAFSIGVYVLSSASYLVFHLHSSYDTAKEWVTSFVNSVFDRNALHRVIDLGRLVARLTYAYFMLLVVFPILITALVEMYVLIPLHTYMGTGNALRLDSGQDGHTVRIIQAWTLGILYLKLGSRALTLYGGRPSQAVRAVLRHGWLRPDISVLTRAFVIPGLIASAAMLLMPPMFAWATLKWALDNGTEISYEMQVSAYRLAYPLTALLWFGMVMLQRLLRIFEGWQVRIRDEAYLMGERLHNFTGTATKATGWRGSIRM
ncbi:hypothetical protein F5Y14DRAFT_405040 [Nemania sp. NC0429]|nr:hypothetical protein F5Y14DRAFT_405040 [Nemania sp. NC0429]